MNVYRNGGFTCPYCRQNLIGDHAETGVTQPTARERTRAVVVVEADDSDSVESTVEPDSVWPLPETDLDVDEEDEEDRVMEIINIEHTAARNVGLPSPYDLSVELMSRFDIRMIDLFRILLGCCQPDETNLRWNLFTRDIFESYSEIISADTLETSFNRVRDSMHTLMQEYYRDWINERRSTFRLELELE
jgi:hypothetical protein